MPMIPKKDALLAVCKALNPFVAFDLVRSTPGGGKEPIAGANAVRIGDALKQLHFNDKKFGTHVIDFIINTLVAECQAAGFASGISPAELVVDPVPITIGDLVIRLRSGTKPVP